LRPVWTTKTEWPGATEGAGTGWLPISSSRSIRRHIRGYGLLLVETVLLVGCGIAPVSVLPAPTVTPGPAPSATSELSPAPTLTTALVPAAASTSPAAGTPESGHSATPTEHAPSPTPRPAAVSLTAARPTVHEFTLPGGQGPHDVAPAPDGTVWYTAQLAGDLGRLDPRTGEVRRIKLGTGSAPHGVIVGPDAAPWITDGGLNAIVRVDPATSDVHRYPLPANRPGANLNTAAFDARGILWFTGQSGVYGRLDPRTGEMAVFDAPRGPGPYGITSTSDGAIFYASLAGSYLGRLDLGTGAATALDPPTPRQGARRVWSDSHGRLWISEWNAGQLGRYDPATGQWREWKLPGDHPQPYAVYVDDRDVVWLSDFGANALVRFDPQTETFAIFPLPSPNASVRQLLGRPGELWGAESGTNKLVLLTTR
jgi:virginiamycin B lyase